MRIQLSDPRREGGAVAITVALFAVILILVAAFTTDFGMAYAQRQALATGADSAALAVIRAEHTSQLATLTRTCATALTQDAALASGNPAKASTIALAQVNANAPFGATIAASDLTTTLSCVSSGSVLQVAVEVNRTMNPILGSVVGASPMQLSRKAKAALGVANGATNLLPIAVCTNQAQDIIAHKAGAQLVTLAKVWPSGTPCAAGGSGNWGWLDFGKGVSVPDLVDYITGAYPYTLTFPLPIIDGKEGVIEGTPGDKGNSGQVVDAMDGMLDKNVNIPVYDTVYGTGANTKYGVIGFLSVKVCGFSSNSKEAVGACYDATTPGVQLKKDDMQVRYADYIPLGQIGEVCAIGSPCASNTYLTKLLG